MINKPHQYLFTHRHGQENPWDKGWIGLWWDSELSVILQHNSMSSKGVNMNPINSSLLKQLHSTLDTPTLQAIASRFQKQSHCQSTSNQKHRLSTSSSFASKHNHSLQPPISSTKHHSKEIETPKYPHQSESLLSIQHRNSKAIYYRTNELPSLHSIDSIMSECVRHTRTKRSMNEFIQSTDLLKIKQLQVFYCEIESLRLLGTGWRIKSLTVIGCKLKDLSGINGYLNLECLFAAYNEIEVLSDLAFNQTLRVIDLEGNHIQSLEEVEYLLTVENLEMLNLDYNPIMDSKRKEVLGILERFLETEDQMIEGYDFQWGAEDDQDLSQYENVLFLDRMNKEIASQSSYYEMISQLKRDKHGEYTEKEFTLDGRFNEDAEHQHEEYLLDDINIFHNPKKAFEKDSVQKYLSIKFNLPEEAVNPSEPTGTKSRMFARRAQSKKSLENKQQKQYSTITSKISIKNQDLGSTGGFNPSSSNAFTDTILSRPDSQKRKFVLRKTSLKKESNIISDLNSPTTPSINRQFLYRTSSFVNK